MNASVPSRMPAACALRNHMQQHSSHCKIWGLRQNTGVRFHAGQRDHEKGTCIRPAKLDTRPEAKELSSSSMPSGMLLGSVGFVMLLFYVVNPVSIP